MDKPKYELGNRIKRLRKELGISQKELAERIGVSNSRVSNWEQGINRPDADILSKLCSALQTSPSLLLGMKLTKDELTEKEWLGEENQLGMDIWTRKYQNQGESFEEWLTRVTGGNEEMAGYIREKGVYYDSKDRSHRLKYL